MRCTKKWYVPGLIAAGMLLIGTVNVAVAECPCDIFEKGGTPCVAAHSTVRALYGDYDGNLYQVRRTADGKTLDVGVRRPGGYADAAVLDTFLNGKAGTISRIYDQSPNKNDLTKSPPGGFLHNGGLEANATDADAKIMINGFRVYGVHTTMSWDNEVGSVGYRNNATKNIATGNQPEGIYMVCSGKRYNQWCCFDYGNAQTDNTADAPAIMETVYFGNSTQWGHGSGDGPWVMADLEWGLYPGGALENENNTPIVADFVTGMVKGDSTNLYAIRGGNAQSGKLKTMHSGKRPKDYFPMKKEGAIVLGIGGDNSHTGEGVFFEGAMTRGYPTDATEDAVQENIIAAGYGSATTSHRRAVSETAPAPVAGVSREISGGKVVFRCTLPEVRQMRVEILDQCGRRIEMIAGGTGSVAGNCAVWNPEYVPAGMYLWRMMDGRRNLGGGKLVAGRYIR